MIGSEKRALIAQSRDGGQICSKFLQILNKSSNISGIVKS